MEYTPGSGLLFPATRPEEETNEYSHQYFETQRRAGVRRSDRPSAHPSPEPANPAGRGRQVVPDVLSASPSWPQVWPDLRHPGHRVPARRLLLARLGVRPGLRLGAQWDCRRRSGSSLSRCRLPPGRSQGCRSRGRQARAAANSAFGECADGHAQSPSNAPNHKGIGEPNMDLKGKTALVTGASRGIGPHIASALAGRGMNLVLTGRSGPELELVAAEQRKRGVRVLAGVGRFLRYRPPGVLVGPSPGRFCGGEGLGNNPRGDPRPGVGPVALNEKLP